MLIHVHHTRAVQNNLAPQVVAELAHIRQRWLYESEQFRPTLKARWEDRFEPVTAGFDLARSADFDKVAANLDRLLRDGIDVKVLNSDTPDELDYEREPAMKSVLIGGNKLSRGLTIEGLLVSYYVRETPYYDTLMQMGRWFGFRGQYVDLTRLYTTELLISWFHDLATAEEELRHQVARYERENITPAQFVPKVRKHPAMLITQKTKMRDAEATSVSFAGERIQTLRSPVRSTQQQSNNVRATKAFLRRLGVPTTIDGQPTWQDVPDSVVIDFLSEFAEGDQRSWESRNVTEYIHRQTTNGELTRWRVLVACGRRPDARKCWSEDLGVEGMRRVPLISRTRLKKDPTSLGVVTDPVDELLGLSLGQRETAEDSYRQGVYSNRTEAFRSQRDPVEGLLALYPIVRPRNRARTREIAWISTQIRRRV